MRKTPAQGDAGKSGILPDVVIQLEPIAHELTVRPCGPGEEL